MGKMTPIVVFVLLFWSSSFALAETVREHQPLASWHRQVSLAAQRFAVPEHWIRAVIAVESNGKPKALSPKGAKGLMQIMPATWRELCRKHDLRGNVFDPSSNILAGTAYISELHRKFGAPGWIAAYNAGPGRYKASLSGRKLPNETLAYVRKVRARIDAGKASLQNFPQPPFPLTAEPKDWKRSPVFASSSRRTTDEILSHKTAGTLPRKEGFADQSASLFAVSNQRRQSNAP